MAADDQLLFAAFVRGAKLAGAAASPTKTAKQVLEAIILSRFTSEATNGRTLISTSEAGGSVAFTFPEMLNPAEVMAYAEKALQWIEAQPDQNNLDLSKLNRVGRLRASFFHARP